jgi:hypothetical protein
MRQAKPHAVSNQPAHNGKSHTTAHDPAATRSRRDARRERKRKSR